MKFFSKLTLTTLFIAFFTFNSTQSVKAATCNTFSVTESNGQFTATGTNCDPRNYRFNILITDNEDFQTGINVENYNSDGSSFSVILPKPPDAGTYSVILNDGFGNIIDTETITVGTASSGSYSCGDSVPTLTPTCPDNEPECCPSTCVKNTCPGQPGSFCIGGDTSLCPTPPSPPPDTAIEWDLCNQAGALASECRSCAEGKEIWTFMGCIPTDGAGLSGALVSFGITIAGGIAILLMLFGAFQITTAASNPQKIELGREIITAAIVGLVFIILSVVILQLIGVEIFQLPGL